MQRTFELFLSCFASMRPCNVTQHASLSEHCAPCGVRSQDLSSAPAGGYLPVLLGRAPLVAVQRPPSQTAPWRLCCVTAQHQQGVLAPECADAAPNPRRGTLAR